MVSFVGGFGGGESGVLAHGPEPTAVHVFFYTAGIWEFPGHFCRVVDVVLGSIDQINGQSAVVFLIDRHLRGLVRVWWFWVIGRG